MYQLFQEPLQTISDLKTKLRHAVVSIKEETLQNVLQNVGNRLSFVILQNGNHSGTFYTSKHLWIRALICIFDHQNWALFHKDMDISNRYFFQHLYIRLWIIETINWDEWQVQKNVAGSRTLLYPTRPAPFSCWIIKQLLDHCHAILIWWSLKSNWYILTTVVRMAMYPLLR